MSENEPFEIKMRNLLSTQDNRITSDVMFIVEQKLHNRWEFVSAFLTEKGAQDFVRQQHYNFEPLRIFGHSGCNNQEWRDLRNYFLKNKLSLDWIVNRAVELGRKVKLVGQNEIFCGEDARELTVENFSGVRVARTPEEILEQIKKELEEKK